MWAPNMYKTRKGLAPPFLFEFLPASSSLQVFSWLRGCLSDLHRGQSTHGLSGHFFSSLTVLKLRLWRNKVVGSLHVLYCAFSRATLMSWHGRILVHLACKIWGKTLGPGLIARKSSVCLHGCWQACTKVNHCTEMYIFIYIYIYICSTTFCQKIPWHLPPLALKTRTLPEGILCHWFHGREGPGAHANTLPHSVNGMVLRTVHAAQDKNRKHCWWLRTISCPCWLLCLPAAWMIAMVSCVFIDDCGKMPCPTATPHASWPSRYTTW